MMVDIISIFFKGTRLFLWPRMWYILENVPCALVKIVYSSVKNVYSIAFG